MIDEIFDRTYQAGRADLHDGVQHLAKSLSDTVGTGLRTLHRMEWSAPWKQPGAQA